jgi:murein DD-endopeptidase MepM/ murein hydrolase activator NlpD
MRLPLLLGLAMLVLLTAIAGACFRWGSMDFQFDENVTVQVMPVASPTVAPPTVTASATRRPLPPPTVEIDPPQVAQGGTAMIRVRGGELTTIAATFLGKALPLNEVGGTLVAFVGIGPDHQTGEFPVMVRSGDHEVIAVLSITRTAWPVENIQVAPGLEDLLTADAAQRELAIRGPLLQTSTSEKLWAGPFVLPSPAAVSDPFGVARSYNNGPVSSYHSGVDFDAATGDPIVAAARGRVIYAGPLPIRGNSVLIDHGLGIVSGYHHLSEMSVSVGDLVSAGARIGRAGATGLVTGPHLHWEVVVRGVNVDGLTWTRREFLP